jgi:hypothetical protein
VCVPGRNRRYVHRLQERLDVLRATAAAVVGDRAAPQHLRAEALRVVRQVDRRGPAAGCHDLGELHRWLNAQDVFLRRAAAAVLPPVGAGRGGEKSPELLDTYKKRETTARSLAERKSPRWLRLRLQSLAWACEHVLADPSADAVLAGQARRIRSELPAQFRRLEAGHVDLAALEREERHFLGDAMKHLEGHGRRAGTLTKLSSTRPPAPPAGAT